MKKVLATMLILFCLIIAIPLVSADPIPVEPIYYSLSFVYIALVIFSVALADLSVYVIRRKRITKHTFLYTLMLSCLISWLIFFWRLLTMAPAISIYFLPKIEYYSFMAFGYITMSISLLAIADSVIYLIRRKSKLTNKQSFL